MIIFACSCILYLLSLAQVPAWPAVWQFHLKFSPKLANVIVFCVCALLDVPTTLNTCELKQGYADILVNLPWHKKLKKFLGVPV